MPKRNVVRLLDAASLRSSGASRAKEKHERLLSLSHNLPTPPDNFEESTQYRVRLKRTVVLKESGHFLRPSHDVVLSGKYAQTIRDQIAGAKAL